MTSRLLDQEMMTMLRSPQAYSAPDGADRQGPSPGLQAQPAWIAGAAVLLMAAGLAHLAIAPLHWGHAPAHGLFFAASGLAQVAWGIAFWREPSTALCRAGMILAGGMITLWAITRAFPAPFGDEPGEIEVTGLVSKGLEGLGLAMLVAIAVSGIASKSQRRAAWRAIGKVMIASLVAGWLTYVLGIAAGPVFPGLAEPAAPAALASAEESADSNPAGESPISVSDNLQLVVAGIASPLVNGGEVPVAGEVMAQLTFGSGEERYGRELDVYLYGQEASAPLDGAAIQATASMRFMDHGTFRPIAYPTGEGHYLLLLQFPMPGEWQLELEITAAGAQNTIYLDLDLFE